MHMSICKYSCALLSFSNTFCTGNFFVANCIMKLGQSQVLKLQQ